MEYGVGKAYEDQITTRECYVAMFEMDDHLQDLNIKKRRTMVPMKVLEEIPLNDDRQDRITRIGT